MKQYTDIEQSRTLAEILPHDTADQTYERPFWRATFYFGRIQQTEYGGYSTVG